MRILLEIFGLLRSLMVTIPLIYLWTIFMGALSLVVSPIDPETHKQHACSRIWSRGLLWLAGVHTRVHGLERVDFSRAYVILANHQSYMDIPTLFAHLPVTFRIMAKSSLFKIPFLGWHLGRTGNIPIGRKSAQSDARALLRSVRYIQDGTCLLVFPEGGRTPNGHLQEFQRGVFLAAIKTGAPILPITVLGTRHVLPPHSWHLRPGKVEVRVDPPIETTGLHKSDLESVMSRTRALMHSHLA